MAAIAAGAMQQESPVAAATSKESRRLSVDSRAESASGRHQDAAPVASQKQDAPHASISSSTPATSGLNESTSSDSKTKNKSKVKEEKKQVAAKKSVGGNKKKEKEKRTKSDSNGASKNQQEEVQVPTRAEPSTEDAPKAKTLVEELKLFQNNHLLNQQDPLQQLHVQLNALIRGEATSHNNIQSARTKLLASSTTTDANSDRQHLEANCLSAMMQQQKQQSLQPAHANNQMLSGAGENMIDATIDSYGEANENLSTVKKGVLWQQQDFEKFHQRLFSRWKKRYFILTTDYLVCFKRSTAKVGRSEMGKFLYKTSLSDVTKIEWLKPLKSDKGSITLHLNGQFNLFLWSKDNLEEWMFLLKESIERNKIRRSCMMQNGSKRVVNDSFYSNIEVLQDTAQERNNQQANGRFGRQADNRLDSERSHNNDEDELKQLRTLADPKNERSQELYANGIDERLGSSERNNPAPQFADTDRGKESSGTEKSRSIERHEDHKPGERPKESQTPLKAVEGPTAGVQGSEIFPEAMINHLTNNDASDTKGLRQSPRVRQRNRGNGLDASTSSTSSSSRSSGNRQRKNDLTSLASGSPKMEAVAKADVDVKLVKASSRGSTEGRAKSSKKPTATADADASGEGELCNSSDRDSADVAVKVLHQRPPSNLIRRDDSWQSLISLARVGRVTPAAGNAGSGAQGSFESGSNEIISRSRRLKPHAGELSRPAHPSTPISVAQRSLYARHIMPDSNDSNRDNLYNRQYMINIESSITPSRAPFLRHQSVQGPSHRKLRPIALASQHAASFDMAPGYPMSPAPGANQQLGANASYQQKLLQLQLLHNSNNVDYIRANGDHQHDEQQIYGPDSTSNYYGYSSMRSNLKSATSEFSFIRPNSTHNQSTLPHPNSSFMLNTNGNDLQQARQQQALRCSLIMPARGGQPQQSDNNNNEIGYLSPETAQQQQQLLTNHLSSPDRRGFVMNQMATGMADLKPPIRELPLKPNKKRTLNNIQDESLPKSSSLTSSIACFFRRAFSKRFKKNKRRSKLAESCSSSLGPLDDAHVPVVPSAFSTGSKSLAGGGAGKSQQQIAEHKLAQSQRMVDMIEAFTNKTILCHDNDRLPAPSGSSAIQRDLSPRLMTTSTAASGPKMTPQLRPRAAHFGGSPLHKSNSISATMGLSLADVNSRRNFLHDNEQAACAPGGSPLISRSSKVMSANLTPLMAAQQGNYELPDGSPSHLFLSPRNSRSGHSARPSSIYGQPSMISSPIMNARDNEWNNFGVHRNSLHNHHFQNQSSGFDIRRQQVMRPPFLDSTKEVAEEISSPTTCEPRSLDYSLRLPFQSSPSASRDQAIGRVPFSTPSSRPDHLDKISASPSSGRLQHSNHAIVNPILQSSTMDTIYDNHPMLNGVESSQYSHYDNHNQLLVESQANRHSPLVRSSRPNASVALYPPSDAADPYTSFMALQNQQQVRSSNNQSQVRAPNADRSTVNEMMMANKKPSAIVAPSTPNHNQNFNSPVLGRSGSRNQASQQAQQISRSPHLSRRSTANQSHYQQSPLVSLETRVLNRGDGVQATIIGGDREVGYRQMLQPVINIAGAPGINLEPSLAASLLRGTNINAYETSTYDAIASDSSKSDSKTFLVSTRLSKSMAYGKSSNSKDSSSSVAREDLVDSIHDRAALSKSSRDELSSSGLRSVNSSSERGSTRAKVSTTGTNSSQEDQLDDSSSGESRPSENASKTNQKKTSDRDSRLNRRKSSSGLSDGSSSQVGSIENPEDRNWITSKLVN